MTSIVHADRDVELRLPDAVGNLFKSPDKLDRTYGPAGELLTSTDAGGVTHYHHDAEGYLREKREPGDRVWKYEWNGSGMLARVQRPDGDPVEFAYDPLGRRIAKTFRGKTTRWLWDGNVPLHEWVELTQEALERDGPTLLNSYEREIAAAKRAALLVRRPAQGPPAGAGIAEPLLEGTPESPITWLFAPETFAPMAKLIGDERYSIICDHLVVPLAMFDIAGERVWAAEIDAYGNLRDQHGPRRACPFRWPGQYEDAETGLYYNRFRYYDPQAGQYICSDPAGLAGGIRFFAYVRDPLTWADPFGLENIVFRALNPTDMTRLDAGESIAPKNPAANATPMDHVLHGSKAGYGDQFVSVTKDRGLAESWARKHGTEVAEIDLDKVTSPVLDLSTGTGRATHLGDPSKAMAHSPLHEANQFARGAKEMLVEGEIPREAVVKRYCA